MPDLTNKTYAIHPAIGVARMGNAELDTADPSTYFIGSESPYQIANEGEPYKKAGKIKKQTQRFRIYEFENGRAVREISLEQDDVESIIWHVHLANRKAALDIGEGAAGTISAPTHRPPDFHPSATRNVSVPPERREALCIDAGKSSVGCGDSPKELSGTFALYPEHCSEPVTAQVKLASIWCEPETGRLLVFGSDGFSQGLLKDEFSEKAPLGTNGSDFANNNDWYDQTGDGPVQAEIFFSDGSSVTLDQPEQRAWVLCGLPKYTPAFNYFTNLQHIALNAAHAPGTAPRPSFAKDIYPILRSVSQLQWVSDRGSLGHATGRQGYYLAQDRLRFLSDDNPDPDSNPYRARHGIFSRLRNPTTLPKRPTDKNKEQPSEAVEPKQMPQLTGDVMRSLKTLNEHDWALPYVTLLQYEMLEMWRDGNFDPDPDGIYDYQPLDKYPVSEQPAALDRAAVEGTCGTPFYPGIESWNVMQLPEVYAAPMRVSGEVKPGDLTIGNALPWQSDYLDCNDGWWPVQRPNHVTRDGKVLQPWTPEDWIPEKGKEQYGQMVEHWWRLGFIVSSNNGATYEESERNVEESSA